MMDAEKLVVVDVALSRLVRLIETLQQQMDRDVVPAKVHRRGDGTWSMTSDAWAALRLGVLPAHGVHLAESLVDAGMFKPEAMQVRIEGLRAPVVHESHLPVWGGVLLVRQYLRAAADAAQKALNVMDPELAAVVPELRPFGLVLMHLHAAVHEAAAVRQLIAGAKPAEEGRESVPREKEADRAD